MDMDIARHADLTNFAGNPVEGDAADIAAGGLKQYPIEDVEPGGDGGCRRTTKARVALDDGELAVVIEGLHHNGAYECQAFEYSPGLGLQFGIAERSCDLRFTVDHPFAATQHQTFYAAIVVEPSVDADFAAFHKRLINRGLQACAMRQRGITRQIEAEPARAGTETLLHDIRPLTHRVGRLGGGNERQAVRRTKGGK